MQATQQLLFGAQNYCLRRMAHGVARVMRGARRVGVAMLGVTVLGLAATTT